MISSDERPEPLPPTSSSALRRAPLPLREAVYRRGASDEDRSVLAAAVNSAVALPSEADGVATSGVARRGRRRTWRTGGARGGILAVLVVVAALAGLWGRTSELRQPRPASVAPRPGASLPARALAGHGDPEERQRQQHSLGHLFEEPVDGSLTAHLALHYPGLIVPVPGGGSRVDRLLTGPSTVDLGHLSDQHPAGVLTVLLVCDRRAAFSWALIAPGPEHDDPTAITARGADCFRHIVSSSLRPQHRQLPTRLEVDVPTGVRVLVTVQVSSR